MTAAGGRWAFQIISGAHWSVKNIHSASKRGDIVSRQMKEDEMLHILEIHEARKNHCLPPTTQTIKRLRLPENH